MQGKARKLISLIAALALLITCAVSGLVLPAMAEETETVTNGIPNGDFEQSEVSGWKYSDNSAVPILTDEKDGNKYVQIPANGKFITSPKADLSIEKGDLIRISFKVRKTATGKMRFMARIYGTVADGSYSQPNWTISDSSAGVSGNNEWFEYTIYQQAGKATSNFYLVFGELSANTTADITLDIDEVEVELLSGKTIYDVNYLNGGDFEDGNIASINDHAFGGLFNDGGVIEKESADSTNHVLHMTKSSSQAYFYPDVQIVDKSWSRATLNDYYKLTYRMKGTGTTAPGITAKNGGTRVALYGNPGVASTEWKTITAYYLINPSSGLNTNYLLDFRTSGDVYIDDMQLTHLCTATDFALAAETMTLTAGETATVELVTTPEGAYVPSLTWTSSDTSVATVEDGKLTAVNEGTATVTVTDGTKTYTVAVTVNRVMASELLLDKGAVTLYAGQTASLSVSASPADGWYDTLVWSSDDESVATVADGVITAKGPGVATVTVSDGNLFTTCVVTVYDDLLSGGDFEASDTVGTGSFSNVKSTSKTWYIAPGMGYGGGNALAIDYRKSDRLIKWPTFAPNTTYELTFVAKGPPVFINFWKKAGSISGWENPTTVDVDGEWTEYRVEFTVGAEGLYPVSGYESYFLIPNRSATLEDTTAVTYIDNFSIRPTEQKTDRVLGGDFEVASPQQWNGSFLSDTANGIEIVTEEDGNRALYLPPSDTAWSDKYLKSLVLKPNTDYMLTYKVKGAPIDMYLHSSYTKGQNAGTWHTSAESDEYITYTYSFTSASSMNSNYILNFTRSEQVGSKSGSLGSEQGTWLDDVCIYEVGADIVADELIVHGGKNEVKVGTELTFGVKLSNQGGAAFEGVLPIAFRLNGQVWKTMEVECTLAAGESKTILADAAWTAEAGCYSVSVIVNADKTIPEGDFYNNEQASEIRVSDTVLTAPSYAVDAGFDKLAFADDFDSIDTIDTQATGDAGYKWYVTRPYGASTLTTDDYKVENGILTLQEAKPTYNYGLGTMDIKTGNGFVFNKGYIEVRFRITRPRKNTDNEKGVPAIWSLPVDKLKKANKSHWVEMDWMEYWGINAYNKYYPNGFYTISIHEIKLDSNGETEYQYKNSGYGKKGLGDAEWHTMGWLWEENSITAYLDGTKVLTQTYSADGYGSPKVDLVEGSRQTGAYMLLNDQYMPLIINGSKDNPMEVDYVYIWQGEEEKAEESDLLFVDTAVEGGEIAFNEGKELDETIEEGTTVTVNAAPAEGYIMKPGSLKYVLSDGTEVKILNQSLTDTTFGGGDGHSFEFEAPAGAVKITAEFIPTEDTSFAADTVGTSLRVTEDGDYDGIRFLTRMNLAATFDPESESLHVKYDGTAYEVVEIGSLLMRYAEGVELNLDNYKWRSRAYVKGRSMALVDYTDSYIDFTVVMTKGESVSAEAFNARQYTARGYVVLKDANGNEKTVLCDTQLTNSVNAASAALN